MKQYSALARRYGSMERTLRSYMDAIPPVAEITPAGWSAFVDRVEQVLDREHEGWLHFYRNPAAQPPQQPTSLEEPRKELRLPAPSAAGHTH
jgi:hypothetical protein